MSTPPPPAPVVPPAPPPTTAPSPTLLPKPAPKNNPFVYLGIPQWLFDWRPSVPSRNMSIFLTVTIGLTSAYVYDRRECARLQKEYIDRVKFMSEASLGTNEMARRVKIYAARVPEDGELERSTKWFKRYMRPLFVASGTDYAITLGTNPGGLGRTVLTEIRARRIAQASKDPSFRGSAYQGDLPAGSPAAVLEEREAAYEAAELDGGTVVLGRVALKEYLWGVRKGWTEEIDLREEARLEGMGLGSAEKRKDGRWEREEELMQKELDAEDAKNPDAPFEQPQPVGLLEGIDDDTAVATNEDFPLSAAAYAPYRALAMPPSPPASSPSSSPSAGSPLILSPPDRIPPQPPLLLVPFSHPFGIKSWPAKLLHFWNHRSDVKLGGESALSIILSQTRPFESPVNRTESGELQGILDENFVEEVRLGMHKDLLMGESLPTGSKDLDFLADLEELPSHFRKTYRSLPSSHEYARRTYYTTDLPPKLAQARELANGRAPTKAELKYAPKLETELRKERLEKELKWRRELQGWAIARSGSGIAWDERWGVGRESENPFKVFVGPSEEDKRELERQRSSWEAEKQRRERAVEEASVEIGINLE